MLVRVVVTKPRRKLKAFTYEGPIPRADEVMQVTADGEQYTLEVTRIIHVMTQRDNGAFITDSLEVEVRERR